MQIRTSAGALGYQGRRVLLQLASRVLPGLDAGLPDGTKLPTHTVE